MTIQVTSVEPSEAAAQRLATLHAQAFDLPWTAEAFSDLLVMTGTLALESSEGFILIRTVADEAEIITLAVRPAARRSGLGLQLVQRGASVAQACGASRLFLEVADDNDAARALYARAGFTQVGRRARYYTRADGTRGDALVLARSLSQRLP